MASSSPHRLLSSHFAPGLAGFRSRIPSQLLSTGVPSLNSLLGGGFPRGSLVEVYGSASSGRTSLALSLLAQATQQQEACAYVDVSDSLNPMSVAAGGVELRRLLWVRCGEAPERMQKEKGISFFEDSPREEKKKHASGEAKEKPASGCGGWYWQHPRDQIRGVEEAIPSLVGDRKMRSASSSSSNSTRTHVTARCAGEQEERDRELPRREIRPLKKFSMPAAETQVSRPSQVETTSRGNRKPWKKLEQALKVVDLLLHSGGWGVVVLDFGRVSWVDTRRINLSMWFRFRRAVENTPTILLLLGEEPCAKSCASLVLRCRRRGEVWGHSVPGATNGMSTLDGFEIQGEVIRSRTSVQGAECTRWQTKIFAADPWKSPHPPPAHTELPLVFPEEPEQASTPIAS